MQLTTRISIIVPARDQAPYICDALASLAAATDPRYELEVLMVDDGSTDGTGELAASFAHRLPGLRILRNEVPTGVSNARNTGLAAATGELIGFLDPDDWVAPGHLSTAADALLELDVDFVRFGHVRVAGSKRTLHHPPQARTATVLDPRADIGPVDAASMVDYCFVWAGLYRRSALLAMGLYFEADTHTAEDRLWIWKLHLSAGSYAVIDAPGVFYRRGLPGSLTQVHDLRQLDFVPIYSRLFAALEREPEPADLWPKAIRQFLAIGCHHLNRPSQPAELLAALGPVLRTALAELPTEQLLAGLAALDAKRRTQLLPLCPPWLPAALAAHPEPQTPAPGPRRMPVLIGAPGPSFEQIRTPR